MGLKIKWNSERILSLSAMSISFITLIIFIHQTNLMSRQNHLSILPYLSLSVSNSPGDSSMRLSLENHGVGPAIIESVILNYQGKQYNMVHYDNEVFTFFKNQKPQLDSIKVISYSTLDPGMAIPVNVSYTILEVSESPQDYQLMQGTLNELLENGLDFEIVYRSIQNERWRITNNSQGPEQLD